MRLNSWKVWLIAAGIGGLGSAVSMVEIGEALAQPPPRSWFSSTSGKCLGTANFGSMANGTPLIVWDCHAGTDQRWILQGERIINTFSGKCVGTANFGSMENGTPLIVWDCHDGSDQKWVLHGDSVRNRISGKCLGTANFGSMANGTQLIVWDCHSGSDQRWRIEVH